MPMLKPLLRLVLFLTLAVPLGARGQSIGIGTTTPNPNAALDISSATKGLLLPRLPPAARRAIAAPPLGMVVFQAGNPATPADSVGLWYATGQGTRWLYLPDGQQTQTTAANGLTKTGTGTLQLGGALNQATTVAAGGQSLTVTAWNGTVTGTPVVLLDHNNNALLTTRQAVGAGTAWQSFTAPQDAGLTSVELWGQVQAAATSGGPMETLILGVEVYEGQGLGGTLLRAAAAAPTSIFSAGPHLAVEVPLSSPVLLRAGQTYTFRPVQVSAATNASFNWQYDADFYPNGRADVAARDYFFVLTGGTPGAADALRVSGAGVQLGGLTGAGTRMVTTAPDGTLGSAPVPADTDAQTLTLTGQNLSISGGNSITLPADTDAQILTRTGQNLSISGGNTITLPPDLDAQTLSLSGANLSISGGNTLALPDASATNELQTLSKTGATISLSNGGGSVTDTDGQTLSLSGANLSISGGNTLTLPAPPADNLGNHAATQSVALNNNFLLLGAAANAQNGLVYSSTLNGPYLLGAGGGALGAFLAPNAVEWNDAGFVGIGGSAPDVARPLVVRGAGTSSQLLGFLDSGGARQWHWNLAGGGLNLAESGVADNRLFIQDGGRVGLGTATPAASLHVAGVGSTVRIEGLEGFRPRLVSADANGTLTAAALEPAAGLDPPAGPAAAGLLAQSGPMTAVAVHGTTALVLTATELRRYNVSNPNAPVLVQTVGGYGGSRIAFRSDGQVAFILNGATLRLLLVGPGGFTGAGSVNLGAGPWEITPATGNRVFVAGGPAGAQSFRVVDVTNLNVPTITLTATPFAPNESVRAVVQSSVTNGIHVFTRLDTGTVGRALTLSPSGALSHVLLLRGQPTAAVAHGPTGVQVLIDRAGAAALTNLASAGFYLFSGASQRLSLAPATALTSAFPRLYVAGLRQGTSSTWEVRSLENTGGTGPSRLLALLPTEPSAVAAGATATVAVVINGLNPGAVQTYVPTVAGGVVGQNPDGSTVSLPLSSFNDDLGSHTATQNIELNDFRLSNDGDDEGLHIDNDGFIGLNTTATSDRAVTIRGTGSASQLLGFRNNANARRFHWNLASNGLNLAETSVADFRLFVAPGVAGGGNVGINTGTPEQELHVVGSGRLDARGAALQLVAPNAGEHTFMEFYTSGLAGGRAGWLGYGADGAVNLELVNQRNGSLIFRTNSATRLRINADGDVELNGDQRTLEFGTNVAGKQADAGKIGYQAFTPGALDIVGAGTSATNRQVKIWAEGGLTVAGLNGTGARVLTADANGTIKSVANTTLIGRLANGGQSGTATVGSNPSGGVKSITVVFPVAFAAVPGQIICTIRTETGQTYTDTFTATTRGINAAGFVVNVSRTDAMTVSGGTATGALWGQNLLVDWVAVP